MNKPVARPLVVLVALISLVACGAFAVHGQSGATRPRRVTPAQPTPDRSATSADTSASPATAARTTAPRTASTATRTGASASDTTQAFALLQQKQYEAALAEARRIAASDPRNSEAWKIAGFAEVNLNRFTEAVADLERALELQRAANEEDENTVEALARAYVRTEKFEQALPLLVKATAPRSGAVPDPFLLYYRGLAEYRTNKKAEAERSFNAAVKADAKNAAALYYLGRIAYERQDDTAAISALNRATLSDARLAEAWTLLTYSYLRRAEAATGAKADADYLGAVRASEGLLRVKSDEPSVVLHAQALVRAQQYLKAAAALERVAANASAQGSTLYLLGFSYSRAKNFPKAAAALERAAAKTPEDANIYRELGYVYESTRQYAKALAAYEKGLTVAPDDADFKAAAERVRPFAK